MKLWVGPLHAIEATFSNEKPARVISLLSPTQEAPQFKDPIPHLCQFFNDIAQPREGYRSPSKENIECIIEFSQQWEEPGPLLIHCWMGISRSTAAAMIITCALAPQRDEREIAQALRLASPCATPNPLMISIADSVLARQGRMIRAIQDIGRGAEASIGSPFLFPI